MDKRPANVLVTGAARRIGRALALDLSGRGFGVGVHYHTSEREAAAVVAEIEAGGGRAVALAADLACEDQLESLVGRAIERLGPLTCLVNNASTFERDTALDATRASWDRHFEVNLRAPFVLIQHFARALPADLQGSIVNLIDERVWNLTPHFVSYTASKAALWTLTRTLAVALAPRIRVNAVGPGAVMASEHETEASFGRLGAALPRGRTTGAKEVCHAVRFLIEAPAVTGQMIAVDGGKHLGWLLPGQDAAEAIV